MRPARAPEAPETPPDLKAMLQILRESVDRATPDDDLEKGLKQKATLYLKALQVLADDCSINEALRVLIKTCGTTTNPIQQIAGNVAYVLINSQEDENNTVNSNTLKAAIEDLLRRHKENLEALVSESSNPVEGVTDKFKKDIGETINPVAT